MPVLFFFITGGIKFLGYLGFAATFFRWKPHHVPEAPAVDAAGCMSEDRFCGTCGYNVRGLIPGGICPECGSGFGVFPLSAPPNESAKRTPNIFLFSLARTIIGLVLGGTYWYLIGDPGRGGMMSAWIGLAPIRFVEWMLVIGLFRKCFRRQPNQVILLATIGTAFSFVLDLPVILGFCVAMGGPPC